MSDQSLERWDALQLFARFIHKDLISPLSDEKKKQVKLSVSVGIHSPYTSKEKLRVKWKAILLELKGRTHLIGEEMSQGFYSISVQLRSNNPTIIAPKDVIEVLEMYTEEYPYNKGERINILPFSPDSTKNKFENTSWWIYNLENRSGVKGITRGIINFKPMGGVELITFARENNNKEIYLGSFHLNALKYVLTMDLKKLGNSGDKELRIRLNIGSSSEIVELALGSYSNHSETVYSGAVMIELCKDLDDQPLKLNSQPQHYKMNDNYFLNYPHVKQFFETPPFDQIIDIDGAVISVETFKWKFGNS